MDRTHLDILPILLLLIFLHLDLFHSIYALDLPLHDAMKDLSPREQKILEMRFGLEDGISHTLEEVGREFDVTRERIRQIEAKALRKLRHPSRSSHLKSFLDE